MITSITEDTFKFFVPLEITKGKDAKGKEKMGFKGIASTVEQDTDGETLMPEGFDLSYFLNNGFVNWNHKAKDNPAALIGEPTVAEIRPEGLYIETDLYADSPLAMEVYKLGKLLSKRNGNRKLGFSIEGKATERDPANKKIVRKAKITGVAITPTPKNPATFADIIKGDFHNEPVQYDIEKGETFLIDMINEDGDRITVDKDLNISIEKSEKNELSIKGNVKKSLDEDDDTEEKSLSTAAGSGKALIKEDLEGSQKNITNTKENDKKDSTFRSKVLSKSETYDRIFDHTDDLEKADSIFNLIYQLQYKNMAIPKKASKIEINQNTIEKAFEALGLSIDGNDLEKGGENIEKENEEDGEVKDTKIEKPSKKDQLKKALEEHEKKGAELKKALDQCEAAPTKKMEGAGENGDHEGTTLQKGELVQVLGEAVNPLAAQIKALGRIAASQQQTINALLEKSQDNDLSDKIDEISKTVKEIGDQSQGRKSLVNTKHLEKGFGNEFNTNTPVEKDGKKVLSVSRQKGAILALYEENMDWNNIQKGEDKLFGDDMARYEAVGAPAISQQVAQRFFKKTGITLVN